MISKIKPAVHYTQAPPELWSSPACPATSNTGVESLQWQGTTASIPNSNKGQVCVSTKTKPRTGGMTGKGGFWGMAFSNDENLCGNPAQGSPPPSLLVCVWSWEGTWRSQIPCRASTESSIDESGCVLWETMYWLIKCKWRKRFFYTENQRHTVKTVIIFFKARVNDMQDISCLSCGWAGKKYFIHRSSKRLKSFLTEDQEQTAISSPPMLPLAHTAAQLVELQH